MVVLSRVEVNEVEIFFATGPDNGTVESHRKSCLKIDTRLVLRNVGDNKLRTSNFIHYFVAYFLEVMYAIYSASLVSCIVFDRRPNANLIRSVH